MEPPEKIQCHRRAMVVVSIDLSLLQKFELMPVIVVQSNIVSGFISDPFGDITQYSFNDTLTNSGITSIMVQNSYTESINLNLFVIPSQSFMNPTNLAQPQYVVRVAVSLNSCISIHANY